MAKWRLLHLLQFDTLLSGFFEDELIWRCPDCGQPNAKSSLSDLGERLRRDFSSLVMIGFPFSGYRQALVEKGFWRIMTPEGLQGFPQQEWIQADILVDRLDLSKVDGERLTETIQQSFVAGLGVVAVLSAGRRYTYGSRFHCPCCNRQENALSAQDLAAWCQGRKEIDGHWEQFEWRGENLRAVLAGSAEQWLTRTALGGTPWWPVWTERLEALKNFGLAAIPLASSWNGLSGRERGLLLLGRCRQWRVSGQDLILDHPENDLAMADLDKVRALIGYLAGLGNRIWLESNSPGLIENYPIRVDFGRKLQLGRPEPSLPASDQLPLGAQVLTRRIQRYRKEHDGGDLLILRGGAGRDESQRLRELFAELKAVPTKLVRNIELLDSDPWQRQPVRQCLLEATGIWSWLSAELLNQEESRRMRLLPNHFVRSDPLGACSACAGNSDPDLPCPVCGGTGLGARVLSLSFAGISVQTLWREAVGSIGARIADRLPVQFAGRIESLRRVGLAAYPGLWPLSALSGGQEHGLAVLNLLWNSPPPSVLGFVEPFRGLDLSFCQEIAGQMDLAVKQGLLLLCIGSRL